MVPTLASTAFIEIALIIFFVVFLLIVVGVLLGRRDRFQRAARIPLDDQTIQTPRNEADTEADSDTDGGAR